MAGFGVQLVLPGPDAARPTCSQGLGSFPRPCCLPCLYYIKGVTIPAQPTEAPRKREVGLPRVRLTRPPLSNTKPCVSRARGECEGDAQGPLLVREQACLSARSHLTASPGRVWCFRHTEGTAKRSSAVSRDRHLWGPGHREEGCLAWLQPALGQAFVFRVLRLPCSPGIFTACSRWC